MFITVKKIRTLGAVLVSAGLTTALVAGPRLNWSRLQPASLLTAGPGGAIFLTALLIVSVAVAAFLLPLIIPRRRLTSVVFFMTLGLAALSIFGTGHRPAAEGLTGGMLMLRAVELILLAAILLGGMLLWRQASRQFWPTFLGTKTPRETKPTADRFWSSRREFKKFGLLYMGICGVLGYVLATQFVRAGGSGDAAFGIWAAFLLATIGTHQLLRIVGSLWLAAAPVAMGIVGYIIAGLIYGTQLVPADTEALMVLANPCDFAGPAVAGCMTGLWCSEHLWKSFRPWLKQALQQHHQRESRQPTPPGKRGQRRRK